MCKSRKLLAVCLAVVGIGVAAMVASEAWAQRTGAPGRRHAALLGGGPADKAGPTDRPLARLIHQRLAKLFELKDQLGLTDDQKASIRTILQNHRDEIVPLVKTVVGKHEAVRAAVMADEPSEETIRAAANELGTAIGDAAVAIAPVMTEIKGVLTEEQLKVLRDFRVDRQMATDEFMKHLSGE